MSTNPLSLADRISSGEFDNQLPRSPLPRRLAVLDKRASDLTTEEAASIAAIKEEFAAALAAHKDADRARRVEDARLREAFRDALLDDNGIRPDHPFGLRMFAMAWDDGHSTGLAGVVSAFEDLMPLWDEAVKMVERARNEEKGQ